MRVVLQRVLEARVEVEDQIVGQIGPGILALLGIAKQDTTADADYLVDKVMNLRFFSDENHKMNRSLMDVAGELLVLSQFTLYGDCRRGRRPSFDDAAPPEKAIGLYDYFVSEGRKRLPGLQTGTFQATMNVYSVNQGPVTLVCDTPRPVRSVR